MLKPIKRIIITLAILYISCLSYLYINQRDILFKPSGKITSSNLPLYTSLVASDFNSKKHYILMKHHDAEQGEKTVIYFHGNAGNISGRYDRLKQFIDNGFGVLAVSYSGYAGTGGYTEEINEQQLYSDARTAMRNLKHKNVQSQDIILYGESLGTGVAAQLATEYEVALTILQSPYTSIPDMAQEQYPFLPAISFLVKDKFNSLNKIHKLNSPLLILHGENDNLIPISQAEALFNKAREPKKFVRFPDTRHNDFDFAKVISEIKINLQELGKGGGHTN
jgi:fermentation-respiration switch protein FrsA (DUF1100 family)